MVKRQIVFMPLMVLAIFLSLASLGWALTITGDPVPVGSWTQSFVEGGKDFYFDTMEVFMITGDIAFKGSGFTQISDSAWTAQVFDSGLRAQATGTATQQIFFDLYFSSDLNVPLAFQFYAYLGGVQVDYALATWTGNAWTIEPVDLAQVPLPGALLLLGVGLVRLAAYGRRKIRV